MRSLALTLSFLIVAGCAHAPLSPQGKQVFVNEYLDGFCSQAFGKDTKIRLAIEDVMMRMPEDALRHVTDRRSPVLFTEIYDSGTAQFASTSEIIMEKGDKPAFQEGFTMIKLSTALDAASDNAAVKGIVAHELAHKVLEHVRKGHVDCDAEREANRLIKEWGFEKEYEAASDQFGRKAVGGAASCQE